MTRPRPALTFLMSVLALCTGFTTITPQPCARVCPLWMQARHQRMHRQPCFVVYFQADDTALEFEDAETPVSKHFDQIESMAYFLVIRSAAALLRTTQSSAVPKIEGAPADAATRRSTTGIPQEATDDDVVEHEKVTQTETTPDAKEENLNPVEDEVREAVTSNEDQRVDITEEEKASSEASIEEKASSEADRKSIEPSPETPPEAKQVNSNGGNDGVVADKIVKDILEDTAKIEPEKSDVIESLSDPAKEATSDSERPSTMHKKEGDRAVGLKDEFLDPLSEAISLDFGRPLEIIEADVPPLREKSNPAADPE